MQPEPVGVDDAIRWLGVCIAMVGALVASPTATAHAWRQTHAAVRLSANRARGRLARWVPWLRRNASLQGEAAAASASGLTGAVTVSASGIVGWSEGAPIDARVEVLDARTRALFRDLAGLRADLATVQEGMAARVAAVESAVHRLEAGMREALVAAERRAVDVDARALPLVVVGVAVSGLAEDASRSSAWAWTLSIATAVGVAWAVRVASQVARAARVQPE